MDDHMDNQMITGADVLRISREVALQLPTAQITHPFGPEWDVFKVAGKVFLLHSRLPAHGAADVDAPGGTPLIVLKAEPGDGHALRRSHPFIFPGYHLNKKHWITVVAPGDVGGEGTERSAGSGVTVDDSAFRRLLTELVTDSYRNVVLGLPRAKRPVDPMVFGS